MHVGHAVRTMRVKGREFPHPEGPREQEGVPGEVCTRAEVKDDKDMKKGGIHWGPRTLESVPDATFVPAAQLQLPGYGVRLVRCDSSHLVVETARMCEGQSEMLMGKWVSKPVLLDSTMHVFPQLTPSLPGTVLGCGDC